jgi:DNA polymerase-3 subunit gamma/tau
MRVLRFLLPMAYQVLARKWRPQRFDDVVGQRGVTQTLRNGIAQGRLAQAFVFAGPRGVGKTTTARILARALNCVQGPTPDPCGACDPCIEIAEGRDIDVLEIDAATHTQVDKVRDVIIGGLAIAPVRDRFRIFIIDEVHQLSSHSFNALLKSVEEPPPHVKFVMATTELDKVPDTILSRAQVFEFRTIGTKAIADQLRRIADAEGIAIDEAALAIVARSAEGSLRDAESALDQVIAFAGDTVTSEEVATVLGLVGRDLLLDLVDAVVREDAATILDRAARAVEAGYDLRTVCRELTRLVRDLMVIKLDPARLEDPDIAAESERERLRGLAEPFSREDLMRAFDLLLKAENDIRTASEPRYALEMALLRWTQLPKLVPLTDLIASLEGGAPSLRPGAPRGPGAAASPRRPEGTGDRPPSQGSGEPRRSGSGGGGPGAGPPAPRVGEPPPRVVEAAPRTAAPAAEPGLADPGALKDALLAEIRKSKKFLYNTVVAQAQRISCEPDRVVFTFGSMHRHLHSQLEQQIPWLETMVQTIAGRRMKVVAGLSADASPVALGVPEGSADASAAQARRSDAASGVPGRSNAEAGLSEDPKADLKARAMADAGVQAMLDVFGAEIKDVEEIDKA